jgi:hypothetical protein
MRQHVQETGTDSKTVHDASGTIRTYVPVPGNGTVGPTGFVSCAVPGTL